jgi:tRNA dimethylallyltransferase
MDGCDAPTGPIPILIVGPTAVGKTDVAVELAERLDGEIVNADSMQLYIGMDIGTAKPDLVARTRVPFHLLDLIRPDQHHSVSDWKENAERAIQQIGGRGKRPIICGGTGLYVRALLDGWSLAGTPHAPALRAELGREADAMGSVHLHGRLAAVDPQTAKRLHHNDRVRIIRALEVYQLTGRPISHYQERDRSNAHPGPTHRIGLTLPRPTLYARIDARVKQMLAQGLEIEVRQLLAQGYSPELGPMRSLGYKEMCAFLLDEIDQTTTIQTIQTNTRRFSKRQQTWFQADPHLHWIDVSDLDSATVATRILRRIEDESRLLPGFAGR